MRRGAGVNAPAREQQQRSGAAADAARTVDVPTLILHSRDDLVWSFAEAEELHGLVAGSRLVALDSRNHILQADEPAFGDFVRKVRGFLAT